MLLLHYIESKYFVKILWIFFKMNEYVFLLISSTIFNSHKNLHFLLPYFNSLFYETNNLSFKK